MRVKIVFRVLVNVTETLVVVHLLEVEMNKSLYEFYEV